MSDDYIYHSVIHNGGGNGGNVIENKIHMNDDLKNMYVNDFKNSTFQSAVLCSNSSAPGVHGVYPYNVSTITISSKILNSELNIINIGKYLEIDNQIIGIKYNYGECSFSKGIYTTTTYKKSKKKNIESVNQILFYNQISLVILYNDKHVNVKLFSNGSLHITGCKHVDDGKFITNLVYNKLTRLKNKTHSILLTNDKYGVLIDDNNFIYNRSNQSCNSICNQIYNVIGYYNIDNNTYVMNNKEFIVYNKIKGSFISKNKEQLNLKSICDNNGDIIGHISYLKNKKKSGLHLTRSPFESGNSVSIDSECNYKIINYSCNPFIKIDDSVPPEQLIQTSIDCINITIALPCQINRQKLYTYFIDNDYICKYNPQSYSGIKLIYKYPFDDLNGNGLSGKENQTSDEIIKNGLCNCNIKCICLNITFLIFQSGNVIVTGCKNLKQVENVVHHFKNIIDDYQSIKM
jgi:hypothetical protein